MNKNNSTHFSQLPKAQIKRSTFDRSFSHKTSGLIGRVIPIFIDEVMAGDTITMDTSKVVRLQTMLTPMMDNLYADIAFFDVPFRLIHDHWEEVYGANRSSAWAPEVEYQVPQLVVPPPAGENDTPNNNKVGTILDYLGYPVGMADQTENIKVSALPVRAYCKIIEDWYRSGPIQDPINIYTGDADVTATTEESYINDLPHGGVPFIAGKFHDYFTSALPSPQRGDAVELALISAGGNYPVQSLSDQYYKIGDEVPAGIVPPIWVKNNSGVFGKPPNKNINMNVSGDKGSFITHSSYDQSGTADDPYYLSNLWVTTPDISADFSISDLRFAFQLQRLLERDARAGSARYIEIIKAHFGVDSPDQRLQRSEYLGGNRFAINVNQVSNTAQSEQDFLGDLGANSVTNNYHSDFTKSFTEPGYVIGVMVLRYDHTYSQGLEKFWKRKTRFDFFWPVFSALGEMPIDKSELYLTGEGTFGYQEAWADYRYKPNRVSGEMRPYVNNGLASWTLADDYESAPSLSSGWLQEDETNVDRVLAVTSQVAHQFWADIYFNFKHTRPMPVYSVPGLIDHF